MPINPYLMLNGNAREAIHFYEEAFQTEADSMQTYGEMPGDTSNIPVEAKALILHAKIEVDGTPIMISDVMPNSSFVQGDNINLTLVSNDADFITHAYETLKQNGNIEMELQETFWTKHFAKLTDQFGVQWQLSVE
ncbi:VOC family protein [Gracilibacillus caseinilyticus]|uniref:VOC family protein n=1 Tax=Gracilibacillus caseinilyticus TaxID=2932256 RepID=A0ABY4ERC6_9BACI|nr:VOC family protein [Gracilibacillus caseinilyticus]UOQ46987.1 VOC family protein [Gracilibacillus caseinilyticus]